jgi:glucose/arabinose dehydrogenase
MHRILGALALVLLVCSPAAAQLQTQVVVTGLSNPVAFLQDPTLTDTYYAVEQGGQIRTVRAGQIQTTDFLDLAGETRSQGEQGLLGMAFAPDYASSGRFFINFTNLSGHTVIRRYGRSSSDPRQADPSTAFDLIWPDGQSVITQPFTNHNGGNLQFGADGYLYIGLGDGGSGNDPSHRAQNPATLLGKMLRIDVNVSDADPEGYNVPSSNPFVGRPGYLAEIWSFGLRNPWRYSFDLFGTGATGALILGDVGQSSYEEIDYEPAGQGGRNYGWRNREGAHNNVTSLAPAYTPLTDPIHEYGRSLGATVVGGYVYRGSALPATYRGRYFYADFVSGRVWSLALSIGGTGEASVTSVEEHTTELGGTSVLGNTSSWGIDANGELLLVGYGGTVRRITSPTGATNVVMALDAPQSGATIVKPYAMRGWAVDLGQSGSSSNPGVDTVHVWATPLDGGAPMFMGASYGLSRPDVAAAFGANFQNSGYSVDLTMSSGRTYLLTAYARSVLTGQFERSASAQVTVVRGPIMGLDGPAANAHISSRFNFSGFAIDADHATGTGVDGIHVWATPSSGSARFLGVATYGSSRPDIAATYGSRFEPSGWSLENITLPAGSWTLTAYLHSTHTASFRTAESVTVIVDSTAIMAVDAPQPGTSARPFSIQGWAVDLAAASGSGISAIHVWAFPTSGASSSFVGAANVGVSRPDVGAVYGSQFTPSGYQLTVTPSLLAAGTYDLYVFGQSTVTGTFSVARIVRVTVN